MKKKMIFRDFSDFSIAGNNWKKKINYNEKRKKKKIDAVGWKSYCSRLYCGARRWLGAGWAHWARSRRKRGQAWAQAGVQGARGRRACVRRAGVARERGAGALGGMGAGALGGTGAGARGAGARGREDGGARGARAAVGAGARGACGAGPAGRQTRGLGAGRAAWADLGQCTRCTLPIFDPF